MSGGALGSLASGIYSFVKGRKQRKEAEAIDDTRPEYTRQKEYDENVAMYKSLSQGRMPGAGIQENQINQGQAEVLAGTQKVGGSATNQLAAITQSQVNKQDQLNNLNLQEQQYRTQMMGSLASAKGALADAKDVEWDYNVNQEFQYNRRRKNQLLAAADFNQQQAFNKAEEGGYAMDAQHNERAGTMMSMYGGGMGG